MKSTPVTESARIRSALDSTLNLTAIERDLESGAIESLISRYSADARIELDRRELAGPIGLRQGLEQIAAAGLTHELRLAAVHYQGAYVIDRCRDRDGTTRAWGALVIGSGLIAWHSHS